MMSADALHAPTPPEPDAPQALAPRGRRAGALRRVLSLLRESLRRLVGFSRSVQPPPAARDHLGNALYGAAQPLLGMRVLARDGELLREAFVPAAWLALFCAVAAYLHVDRADLTWLTWGKAFYKTFAALAVAPPILFANHYARLAAQVRFRLGFGACGPREASLWFFGKRALQGVVLVALAIAPVALFEQVPLVGELAAVVLGLWGLHWVVVDAFDDARVLLPGETLQSAEAAAEHSAPPPWFVRAFQRVAERLRGIFLIGPLTRWFARACDRLSVPWREEIALLEKNRALALGFAVATSTLLAAPVLNLLFRPIIIIASAHLLGHLEATETGHGHPSAPDELGAHDASAQAAPQRELSNRLSKVQTR